MRKRPPHIEFRQQRFDVPTRPHPRRVAHLQVKTTTTKDSGEVEFPVEEAVLLGNLLSFLQPRSLRNKRRDVSDGSGVDPVIELSIAQSVPVDVLIEHGLAAPARSSCAPAVFKGRAQQLFKCLEPFIDRGRLHICFCQRPEPQSTPGIHYTAQTLVRAIRILQGLFNLRASNSRSGQCFFPAPQRYRPPHFFFGNKQPVQREFPQCVDPLGQCLQPLHVRFCQLLPGGVPPRTQGFCRFGRKLLTFCGIGRSAPAGTGQQELVHGSRHAGVIHRHPGG